MLPPVMLPVTETVVPVCVVALTLAPPKMLPPVMLAVVVTFDVELIADTTFELKLKPAAFRLPPVMLPVTLTVVPVTLPTKVPIKLPPEILAVVVMLAADTKALTTFELKLKPAAFRLPPVTLPVAEIKPVTYSPVVANTATFDVPPMPMATLPPELTTVTLLVPLLMLATEVITPVSNAPLPNM